MCELSRLYVHHDYRGIGVSDMLVKSFIDEAASSGIEAVKLSVASPNVHAIGLYHRRGFNVYGRLDGEFHSTKGRVAGLHMIKRLSTPKCEVM